MTKTLKLPVVVLLAGLGAWCVCGCSNDDPTTGYTTESQFRDDVKTVAVSIWTRGKDVYRRDIETRLTEALVKRVQEHYRIAPKETADTELTGELVRIDQQTLDFDPDTGKPRELEAVFTISFVWKDLRTGKNLVKVDNFQVSGTYISHEPFYEDFPQGSEDVINKLARLIVEHLEKDW